MPGEMGPEACHVQAHQQLHKTQAAAVQPTVNQRFRSCYFSGSAATHQLSMSTSSRRSPKAALTAVRPVPWLASARKLALGDRSWYTSYLRGGGGGEGEGEGEGERRSHLRRHRPAHVVVPSGCPRALARFAKGRVGCVLYPSHRGWQTVRRRVPNADIPRPRVLHAPTPD